MREITEAEARGLVVLFYGAAMYAKQTVGLWYMRDKKPTKDELLRVIQNLASATIALERIGNGPETDGHDVDLLVNFYQNEVDEANALRRELE